MQVKFSCDADPQVYTHKCSPLPYNSNDPSKPFRCGYWTKYTDDRFTPTSEM